MWCFVSGGVFRRAPRKRTTRTHCQCLTWLSQKLPGCLVVISSRSGQFVLFFVTQALGNAAREAMVRCHLDLHGRLHRLQCPTSRLLTAGLLTSCPAATLVPQPSTWQPGQALTPGSVVLLEMAVRNPNNPLGRHFGHVWPEFLGLMNCSCQPRQSCRRLSTSQPPIA